LLLFGLLCRTSGLPGLKDKIGHDAKLLAGIVSLIWGIHPIQTESVTYIVQRSESLMGMFYLLTLYCFVRGLTLQNNNNRWFLWGIISCSLGMLCKPVMVTAPLVVILYDRTFISGSLSEAFKEHKREYLLLVATLFIPMSLLVAPNESSTSAGFGAMAVGPLQYLVTQCGVIIHYVRLVIWPVGLCLDYDWIPSNISWKTIVEISVVSLALVTSLWMFHKQRIEGFVAISFFVLLFPSSGIVPLSDCAAEHRMYLPSVCVIIFLFSGLFRFIYSVPLKYFSSSGLILILVVVMSGSLGVMTIARNRLYLSEEHMWRDVVAQCPANLRGHLGVGAVLLKQGNLEGAEHHFLRIIEDPRSADNNYRRRFGTEFAMAYNNLGVIAFERKQIEKASVFFERSLLFGKIINAEDNLRLVERLKKNNKVTK